MDCITATFTIFFPLVFVLRNIAQQIKSKATLRNRLKDAWSKLGKKIKVIRTNFYGGMLQLITWLRSSKKKPKEKKRRKRKKRNPNFKGSKGTWEKKMAARKRRYRRRKTLGRRRRRRGTRRRVQRRARRRVRRRSLRRRRRLSSR